MTALIRTAAILSLAAVALYMLQPAAANPLPYTLHTNVRDTNGDGVPDPSAGVTGGYACGCYCAVYTTTLHIEAAGQDASAQDISGCQVNDGATVHSGAVDPDARPVVTYSNTCWGPCPV